MLSDKTFQELTLVFAKYVDSDLEVDADSGMEQQAEPLDHSQISEVIADLSTSPRRDEVLKHWLPTFLHSFESVLAAFNAEILGANLHASRWRSWSSLETQVLESGFREIWLYLLQHRPDPRVLDDFLCFRAMAGGSIQWYLESGSQVLSDALAEHNAFDPRCTATSITLRNPWWEKRRFQRDELINWIQSRP